MKNKLEVNDLSYVKLMHACGEEGYRKLRKDMGEPLECDVMCPTCPEYKTCKEYKEDCKKCR